MRRDPLVGILKQVLVDARLASDRHQIAEPRVRHLVAAQRHRDARSVQDVQTDVDVRVGASLHRVRETRFVVLQRAELALVLAQPLIEPRAVVDVAVDEAQTSSQPRVEQRRGDAGDEPPIDAGARASNYRQAKGALGRRPAQLRVDPR